MREIEEEMLGRNKELLVSVARTLGGEVRLEWWHRRVPLDDRSAVLVVMGDPPRMALTVLVEAFGVAAARNYVERQLIPYFAACGVHVEGSSGDALQRARLDDPRRPAGSFHMRSGKTPTDLNRVCQALTPREAR